MLRPTPAPLPRSARALLLVMLVLAAVAPAPAVHAAPLNLLVTKFVDTADGVCSSSDCSLREAIIAANANPGQDVITIPGGSFELTLTGAGEDAAATGDLDITQSATFIMSGTTTIAANGLWNDRIFHILPGVTATLTGLALSGGKAGNASGGAILNQGTLTLNNSTISGSSAAGGGGIANTGTLTLNTTMVHTNTATGATNGGGISSSGTLTLNNSTVNTNTAAGGSGGGLSLTGFAMLNTSTINGNSALGGGGIANNATLDMTDSTVGGNSATTQSGGGIANSATLTLNRAVVYGNSASGSGRGGGVLNTGALALTNSTLSGNSAASGGGLANTSSAALASATIARNSASGGSGGGLVNDAGKTLTLKNTLVGENSGSAAPDCAGTLSSQGYNLVSTVAGACVVAPATGDKLNQDAQLSVLKDNGGPTLTHGLLPTSPALDAASPSGCPGTDQRGVARPQMGRCDIGAFELVGISIVDYAFQPKTLIVSTGTTVRWKNLGSVAHGTRSTPNGFENWNAPALNPGETFLHTFSFNGTYTYYCPIHQNMSAQITVVGQPTTAAPLLTSLNPNTAPAGSPALSLVLLGLNFAQNAIVTWNGTPLQVTSYAANQLIATVPAALLASAGVANVQVVNPDDPSNPSNMLKFTITAVAAPVLDTLVPASATAGGPAFTLMLTGSNFAVGATVDWNGTTLTPTSVSATQVVVQIPANLITTPGTASVKVVNPPASGGASNALIFTITAVGENPVPALISLNPNSAQAGSGGLTLTINGTGFVAGATVQFGGTTLVPSATSSGQITVSIPANLLAAAGSFTVTVTNPAPGGGVSNGLLFQVVQRRLVYVPLARK